MIDSMIDGMTGAVEGDVEGDVEGYRETETAKNLRDIICLVVNLAIEIIDICADVCDV
jgi:hypothetical protein